jgi:ABC-type transporter Mla subunit MlaD
MRRASSLALLALVASVAIGCSPPRPDVRVAWAAPVEVDVEVGAPVRYQGVPIGEVVSVSLLQTDAHAPAQVELGLAIDDPDVALREGDVFEIESDGFLGSSYVAITPTPGPSDPLPHGARVAGTPPLVTQMRESADAMIESLGDLAREKTDALIEAWAREEETRPEPRRVPGGTSPADPR